MPPHEHDQRFVSMVIKDPIKLAIKIIGGVCLEVSNLLPYCSEVTGKFNKAMVLAVCELLSKFSPCHKHWKVILVLQ